MPRTTDRAERLAKAAERIFAERGYAAVAIRDVAAAADLPAGTVYYHYPKKADLASTVAQRHQQGIQNAFGEILPARVGDQVGSERLASVLSSGNTALARHIFGVARLATELASEGSDAEEARMACQRAMEMVEDRIRRCLLGECIDALAATSSAARISMAWLGASVMARTRSGSWWEQVAVPEVLSMLREARGMPAVGPPPGRTAKRVSRKTLHGTGTATDRQSEEPRSSPQVPRTESQPPRPTSADDGTEASPATPRKSATPAVVLNVVGRVLEEAGEPLARRELLVRVERILLAEHGLGMPGRNPFENLLTIVSKDRSRAFINLTPHGIWIRAKPYAGFGYVPGAEWKRQQAPDP